MSGKLTILIRFLDDWNAEKVGNKVLVFSQTKKMLNLLELILNERGLTFCRMDGDVALKTRMDTIAQFNALPGENLSVFLLTTRVGGLGINLTSANKVVIFDPDWNPMVDVQATERAFRIGQTRDVNIYRFVSEDTIEEKIYHRQIFKKFMADRILADPARRKLFERETLYNLLTLPKQAPPYVKTELPDKEYSPTTYGGSSQEEEGQIKPDVKAEEVRVRIKCLKVSKKAIKKDAKLQDYIKAEEKRLMAVSDPQLNKHDRKEELIVSLMQPAADNPL